VCLREPLASPCLCVVVSGGPHQNSPVQLPAKKITQRRGGAEKSLRKDIYEVRSAGRATA